MHDNKKNLGKLISLSSTLITGNKSHKQNKPDFICVIQTLWERKIPKIKL